MMRSRDIFCLLPAFIALWAKLPVVSADLGICIIPPDEGLCFILQERWYFSYERKECLPFTWGGCHGNENNFESRKLCEAACSRYA
ncbi:kunitz-type serine protease inhibitor bitisilin-2-like [Podarcis raffonei]|uniref:kunitz-type serine protease inhibitor bitisilin-2-like n=1 Tax=Podarcis raffonei TaxID=65483 RepID=UPI0023298FFA|nr:kunitz-type serine protease inhibitor bitisilin-2-like [Podarcis raffonei]